MARFFGGAVAGLAALMVLGSAAKAQGLQFRPGWYAPMPGGVALNPVTGSVITPGGGAVVKPSGVYTPVGGGYYQNPWSGNLYNPGTGSYLPTRPWDTTSFRPGSYQHVGGGVGVNPVTGSVITPGGGAVIKPSGIYTPVGGGYYQNPMTGNVYNPSTGLYRGR